MTLYVYDPVELTVVAEFEGESNKECEAQAAAANFDDPDDYAWTYTPAFGTVGGLRREAA